MIVCVVIYVVLLILFLARKRKRIPEWMRNKRVRRVMFLLNTVAMLLFVSDRFGENNSLVRNPYGGISKTQEYQVSIDGALEDELVVVEIGALEYSDKEIKDIFQSAMLELDKVVLGKNKSRDRVEENLNLVKSLDGFPVKIAWELEPYGILDTDGTIFPEKTTEEGSMVKATATLSYGANEAMYVTNFMVYPKVKTEKEKWLNEIEESIATIEKSTRSQEKFELPETVAGKQVYWKKKEDTRGYDILFLGVIVCVLILWKEKQDEKEAVKKRQEQLQRDYPDILSKFTLLLETGMTLKAAWKKIVENYEEEKNICGKREAYEEMCITYHEMHSGVAEAEAYERFGKRCGVVSYMKLGTLLSQNLRKGSQGLASILSMESMQAFEIRKSEAKRRGEEASTKLLLPMFAMLAVVMVVVVVPAFMSIQL